MLAVHSFLTNIPLSNCFNSTASSRRRADTLPARAPTTISTPVTWDFNKYFAPIEGKKKKTPNENTDDWMRSCGLVVTPELEVVLEPALEKLMKHEDLAHLRDADRNTHVLAVGSALLQLLAVQQELDEPLNLNGDLLGDLLDDRVNYSPYDGVAGLAAMFSSVAGAGPALADRMLKFNSEHVSWDDDFRHPTFRRDEASRFKPTAPIPVVVKRKGEEEIEGEPPSKRTKGYRKVKKPSKAEANTKSAVKPKPVSTRQLRSRH
ncbi:hypothetical protein B0H13DRAFT_2302347 [Mycena leptocephala]|nr:hypothetical protein B0H13DRAFT_2302347 [Mycena leptocephala]